MVCALDLFITKTISRENSTKYDYPTIIWCRLFLSHFVFFFLYLYIAFTVWQNRLLFVSIQYIIEKNYSRKKLTSFFIHDDMAGQKIALNICVISQYDIRSVMIFAWSHSHFGHCTQIYSRLCLCDIPFWFLGNTMPKLNSCVTCFRAFFLTIYRYITNRIIDNHHVIILHCFRRHRRRYHCVFFRVCVCANETHWMFLCVSFHNNFPS